MSKQLIKIYPAWLFDKSGAQEIDKGLIYAPILL